MVINLDRSLGVCMQMRGKAKEFWGSVSEDPQVMAEGKRDRLAGRVQEQRGIAKEKADRQLEEFMSRHRRWWDLSRR